MVLPQSVTPAPAGHSVAEIQAPQELRCECSRRPLLAKAGIEKGEPFLWIRHTKSSRPIIDVKFMGGRTEIVCRECRRVWRVRLGAIMEVDQPSSSI